MTRYVILAAALVACGHVSAEPYFAVDKGLQCSACHTHAAGGGKRNAYGNIFAQTELPARPVEDASKLWNGQLNQWLAVGADLRGQFLFTSDEGGDDLSEFEIERGAVYVEASVLQDKVTVYLDQQIAPNASINREAYVMLKGKSLRLTAGQFFLPFGLRLQDDTAYTRRVTGVNFTNPDRGVQLGYETGAWSSAIAVSNGSGGGSEFDNGKQISLFTSYASSRWRLGASLNHNDGDGGDRRMASIFGGVKTGSVSWLLEVDAIQDSIPGLANRDGLAGIVEGNWRPRRGHNIKITYEYFDPDTDFDEDHEVRYSALYEYTPLPFLQARFGLRSSDGPPQTTGANRDQLFVELHGFF